MNGNDWTLDLHFRGDIVDSRSWDPDTGRFTKVLDSKTWTVSGSGTIPP
jgi:hypothetical protein